MKTNLNAVRTFVLVAQTGSLTKAAERLSVTQGAVSQQISKLEEYLGVQLFERGARGLTITEPGRRLYRGVSTPLSRVDSALHAARLRPQTEELSVTCNASFAAQCLLPCLSDFEEKFPSIRLRLETTTRVLDFGADGVDIAVRQGEGGWPGVTSELLCRDRAIAVATPDVAQTYGLPGDLSAICSVPLLYDLENPTEWHQWFDAAGLPVEQINLSRGFNDTLVMLGALRAGVGAVGLVGRQLVCQELALGELVQLSDVSIEPAYSYFLVYPDAENLSAPAHKFREWLTSWFAS